MFSLACNLLQMNAYSNNFQNFFLAKNLYNCNQIRPNQIAGKYSEPFSFLIDHKIIRKTYQND